MTSEWAKPLLAPAVDGGSWRDIAIIGGRAENDGVLAAGFFEAADILVKHWSAHRPVDRLALPILANYRHGIELALKHSIRAAAECARRDGDDDPNLAATKLDADLASTHSLGDLAHRLTGLLGRLRLGEGQQLPADTLEVLQSLHVLDESGQTFRYATIKVGTRKARKLVATRPDQVHFDLPGVATALDEVGSILLYGVSGVLDQYSEHQDYLQDQMGGYSYYS